MRVGRPWGREGRTSGTGRAGQVMHDFLGIRQPRKVYQQLETRADAFAAAGLAEIRDRGGNLEWTVQLLFGTQRMWVTGSLLALINIGCACHGTLAKL